MKAEGVSWSNYVINGMTIKLLNNTGSAILNEDMTSRFFISEYPNVYYADYDWKNGIMVFLCDNLENGVNYSWELWSGDYEDKIIAATAQAVVNNGRANLAFKDLSGNAYDFLNSDRNSFYVSIYNGDECVCNSQYIYLRMNDVDTLEEEYVQMMLKRDHARYVVHKAQRELKDADYIQEVLKLRAGDLDEFNPDGTVNDSHNIQNIDEIPAYGHVTNNDVHSDIACLLDGRLEIDASSDFWMWPVSNGMISAGTWSYPRRKHAFGFRYCCRSIQRAKSTGQWINFVCGCPCE
jgi:hypothetical protein